MSLLDAADAVQRAVRNAAIMARPIAERVRSFNETTGVVGYISQAGPLGGNWHPDRCKCQGDPPPPEILKTWTQLTLRRGVSDRAKGGDTTPHKHHSKPPYSCARCPCKAYVPHDWPDDSVVAPGDVHDQENEGESEA